MPKLYPYVNSFNAGEISELLYNREDIAKYHSACRTLENALPLVEGGAKKMPGTYFAGAALGSQGPCRLVPFQFSTSQGAVLEFSPGAIRIWEPSAIGAWNLGLVLSGGSPLLLPTPYLQADLFQLDCGTQSADVLWVFHPNYPPACVERLGPSTWQYTTLPPGGPPLSPGNPAYRGTPDVVTTGFSAIGVPILQATQAYSLVLVTDKQFQYGDRVYINECSGMVEINEGEFFLTPVLNNGDQANFTGQIDGGSSTESGTILNVASVASGTILVGMQVTGPNVSPNTIITELLGGSGGSGTYSVSIPQLVKSGTGMIGLGGFAYNLIPADPTEGGVLFTGSISGTVLTVTAITAGLIEAGIGIYFPGVLGGTFVSAYGTGTGGVGTYSVNMSQTAGSQNMSGVPVQSISFLPYSGGGFAVNVIPFFAGANDYPSCGTFYDQRLCVAGSNNNPTKIFGSVEGDYPNFICDPNEDDYAFQFVLVSTKLDQIISMVGAPSALLVGTIGGVWTVSGTNGGALSQSNVNAVKQTTNGVNRLQAQLGNDSAFFVSRGARVITFFVYNYLTNQWENFDATRLNRQITIGTSPPVGGGVAYPSGIVINLDGGKDNLGSHTGNDGDVLNLKCIELFSDGSTVDVTATGTWTSSGSGIGSMSLVGGYQQVILANLTTSPVNGVVQCVFGAFTQTLAITVNGSTTNPSGLVLNFDGGTDNISTYHGADSDVLYVYAIALYSDGTNFNVSSSAAWSVGTGLTLGGVSGGTQSVTLSNSSSHSIVAALTVMYGGITRVMHITISGTGGP